MMKKLPHALTLAGALLTAPSLALAQSTIEEDAWYNPMDWFDGNNYSIETDDYDTWDSVDYGYDADYWDDYTWYDDVADRDYYEGTAIDVYPYDYQYTPVWTEDSSGSSSGNADKSAGASLRGTIEGVRQMKLQDDYGLTDTYTVARVKLEGGQTTVVNLGQQGYFRDLDLKKGDQIKAIGKRGEIAGQPVFVAQQLKADGRTLYVNNVMSVKGQSGEKSGGQQQMAQQQKQQKSGQAGQSSGGNQQTVQGQVASFERIDAGGDEHTLVRLELQNGQTRTIDLGANASLNRLDLSSGDRITVKGRPQQIAGREVVVAQQLKIDGRKVNPSRAAE